MCGRFRTPYPAAPWQDPSSSVPTAPSVSSFPPSPWGPTSPFAITAVDWNGNTGTASLPLQKQAGNGIPSFSVQPGNGRATLTWDAVPNTTGYALYYSINGSLPTDTVGIKLENVTSPCVISNLVNGNLHVFRLQAIPREGWPECLSDYVKLIPLSDQTLAPQVTGEPGQIRVEWKGIPASDNFEVWRSTQIDGTYYNLSGPIRGNSYIDRDVLDDIWYYYKVKLAEFINDLSTPNAAQTSPWCVYESPLVCSRSSICEKACRVRVSGSYAYLVSWDKGLFIFDISNPECPTLIGSFDSAGVEIDVAVSGNYAYLAAETAGLIVLDVSTPSAPFVVDTYNTPDNAATGVAISGIKCVCLRWQLIAGAQHFRSDQSELCR